MRLPRLPMASAISASQSIFFSAERDLDVVVGAGETARRLEEEIRLRRRFLAGEFRAARRRHAGADHLVDVFLKVLRGVEHLPGRVTGGSARKPQFWRRRTSAFLFEEGHDLLQHRQIGVPVFQQAKDAVGGAQCAFARRGAARRLRSTASSPSTMATKRLAALFGQRRQLEGTCRSWASLRFLASA